MFALIFSLTQSQRFPGREQTVNLSGWTIVKMRRPPIADPIFFGCCLLFVVWLLGCWFLVVPVVFGGACGNKLLGVVCSLVVGC